MGLLNRLKGKTDGQIQVQVEPEAAAPGTVMTVRFAISDLDDRSRSVRAGISCTGHYRVEERDKDNNGNITTNEVWQTVDLHTSELPGVLRTGEQEVEFNLPDHVAPSSDGVVVWEAWARIDRAKGIDAVERMPFEVRVPIDRVQRDRTADPADDGLTIAGLTTAVAQDDTVTGTLVVDVDDDVSARAVKIRLHRRVTYVAQAINDYDVYAGSLVNVLLTDNTSKLTDDIQVAEIELLGKESFEKGKRRELPFEIKVPPLGPTSSHPYAQVDWRVGAVLDRRLRGDKEVETPVIVV